MDIPVFFEENIDSDSVITLTEDTSRHVVQVLRMKQGEHLMLSDGKGNIATAEIIDDHKKKCTVNIIKREPVQAKNQSVCIAISLLKNTSRFEWFLEKATEIGVSEIIPLLCDRTEKQHFKYERMNQVLISAMMQSKQAWLPVLHQPVAYSKAIINTFYETKLIAHCEEETKEQITDFRKKESVLILIGPEGDFSPEEIETARANGYRQVSLGETRLRAETAGVVAATILCI